MGGFPRTTEQYMSPFGADCFSKRLAIVATKIVHHNQISGLQRRTQNTFDTGAEDVTVHRTIENPWPINAVMAQSGDECRGVPMPESSRSRQARGHGRPAP